MYLFIHKVLDIRLIKLSFFPSGGIIVIVMRKAYPKEVDEYKDSLESLMEQLISEKKWTRIEKTCVPRYSFQNDGMIYVFKVL